MNGAGEFGAPLVVVELYPCMPLAICCGVSTLRSVEPLPFFLYEVKGTKISMSACNTLVAKREAQEKVSRNLSRCNQSKKTNGLERGTANAHENCIYPVKSVENRFWGTDCRPRCKSVVAVVAMTLWSELLKWLGMSQRLECMSTPCVAPVNDVEKLE